VLSNASRPAGQQTGATAVPTMANLLPVGKRWRFYEVEAVEFRCTRDKLALELHVRVGRESEIANERRGVTADTALRLARHFGTSADFWMNIETSAENLLVRRRRLAGLDVQASALPYRASKRLQAFSAWGSL
jgi:antitoxin HigA-1